MKPKVKWMPSIHGGWYAIDADGNYWHRTANQEVITVTSPEGCSGAGWTEEQAWNNLLINAA